MIEGFCKQKKRPNEALTASESWHELCIMENGDVRGSYEVISMSLFLEISNAELIQIVYLLCQCESCCYY